MSKIGRKLFQIDWKAVDNMCAIHCTGEEIAGVLGCDYDTLATAIKRERGVAFSDYYKQKSASGNMSLRRKQYSAAMDGNSTMLVWLGKNWLGQTDRPEDIGENNAQSLQVTFDVKPAVSEVKVTNAKPE